MYTFSFSFLVRRHCDHIYIQKWVSCIIIVGLCCAYKVLWVKNFKFLWLRCLSLCDYVSLRGEMNRLAIHYLACDRIDSTFVNLIVNLWLFDRDSRNWITFTVVTFIQGWVWIGSSQLILLYLLFSQYIGYL